MTRAGVALINWVLSLSLLPILPAIYRANDSPSFEREIKPILEKSCFSCHRSEKATSGLSLENVESILRGGALNGPAILAGNSATSPLMLYVQGKKIPPMPMGSKPLQANEIALIGKWIEGLSASKQPGADSRANPPSYFFGKLTRPRVPEVKEKKWLSNPIDAFLLAKLENKELQPAPSADRRVLQRRIYFDLIGLPPSPEDAERFMTDRSADAYDKEIDRLLADPRYGERWGRHWLDLVRYADSEGGGPDYALPHMWRYRDYVIRAFNQDRAYDRFVREQIAGDTYSAYGAEGKLGLGFLSLGVVGEDSGRQHLLVDAVDTVGSVFLGITLGCARCHDHKYDPISQRDYYRMQAFFASMTVGPTDLPFIQYEAPAQDAARWKRNAETWDKTIRQRRELKEKTDALFAERVKGMSLLREFQDLKDLAVPVSDFDIKRAVNAGIYFSRADQDLYRLIARQNASYGNVNSSDLFRPKAHSAWESFDRSKPDLPGTYVLLRGDPSMKGELVEPGVLSVLTPESISTKAKTEGSSRRLLADWIASAENPLTARVMVNRIWQHHFGKGLVLTPSDVGRNGSGTIHADLIDWLACYFIDAGWSMKAMHRLILRSSAYKQSSEHPEAEACQKIDPENLYHWRWNPLRLEAEVIRDSTLAASGQLNLVMGGPGFLPAVDDDLLQDAGTWWEPSSLAERNRRTVYMWQSRSFQLPMLGVFDGPNINESCSMRDVTTVTPQVFALFNGKFVHEQSRKMALRVEKNAGETPGKQVERAFQLAFQRAPTAFERSEALAFLGRGKALRKSVLTQMLEPAAFVSLSQEEAIGGKEGTASGGTLADLCLILLNTNEFVFLE